MDRDALHDRIRRLLFASPALARAFSRGDFRSVFRGRGIEFDSLREYTLDDDARLMDFRATVRLGRPFVRTFREDRSLTVFLLIDVSASMDQGSGELSKLDMAVLVSSLVAYAAQFRGLPVGCLLFAGKVLGHLAPRRGKAHALAVAEAAAAVAEGRRPGAGFERGSGGRHGGAGSGGGGLAGAGPDRSGSDLAGALKAASLALKRRSLVLLLSDFRSAHWARPLGELARLHDLVAVRIGDRSDTELPRAGAFHTVDPETGRTAWLPLGSRTFRTRWRERGEAERRDCLELCSDCRVPVLEIDSADDPARRLLEFFERRRKT
ncbi:MAG TPA: DUF58 domain-containing protein [Rectinemataceae bacterium]|nr:DUF58 domain-containing protein [Rectinemataceae bacterium]